MVLLGTGIGLLGALGATRLLSSLLYEVTTTDLSLFVGIPILLIFVDFLACYIPAQRAARINPIVALRCE